MPSLPHNRPRLRRALALPAALLALPLLAACDADGDGVRNRLDCAPYDREVSPHRAERCDGIDNDCDGVVDEGFQERVYFVDADGDGVGGTSAIRDRCGPPPGTTAARGDCNDRDPSVFPDAVELCDGIDNDCDGFADDGLPLYFPDNDGDGYPAYDGTRVACDSSPGWALPPFDCDDRDGSVNPATAERCNGRDDDCDGQFDEAAECAEPAEGA